MMSSSGKIKVVPLGEIADVKSGYAFKSLDYQLNGVKLVRIGNLSDGKLAFGADTVCIPDGHLKEYDEFALDEGDVLIAMSGATTGKLALVSKSDLPCLLNQRVGRFKVVEKDKLHPKFLFYFLSRRSTKNKILELAGGSAQPNISPTHLKELLIPLLPLLAQQQIAAILEKADAAREKRRQANQLTEQFLQSAFLEMFGDPATNPKGWEVVTIDDISKHVSSGSTPLGGQSTYLKEGILFIRSQNVLMNHLDYSDIAHISTEVHHQMKRTWVKNGDVLLNITGASIGRVCYFKGNDDTANVNQHVCIIRPFADRVLPEYLSFFISMPSFQNVILARNSGATRQAFTFEQIRKFRVNLPPLSEQQKFAALVEKVESLRAKQRQSEQELEHLFHSLMQRAFRGELVGEQTFKPEDLQLART